MTRRQNCLGLGYPGGPALSKLADRICTSGKPRRFDLPRPMLHSGDFNFSFSGLKTAVLTLVKKQEMTQQTRGALAFAFQEAVIRCAVGKVSWQRSAKPASLDSWLQEGWAPTVSAYALFQKADENGRDRFFS